MKKVFFIVALFVMLAALVTGCSSLEQKAVAGGLDGTFFRADVGFDPATASISPGTTIGKVNPYWMSLPIQRKNNRATRINVEKSLWSDKVASYSITIVENCDEPVPDYVNIFKYLVMVNTTIDNTVIQNNAP